MVSYNELTVRYFETVVNAGVLTGPGTFRGAAGSRAQGTWVQFDLWIGHGVIEAARFLAFACPHTIAVAAWTTERVVGAAPHASLPDTVAGLQERFAVPVEKLGRLLIIEDAWRAAVAAAIEYRS